MDATVINPFLKATVEVIKTMAFTTVTPGKPYLKKNQKATGDVTSVAGLTGEPNGTISISFDQESILHITSKMFAENITELTDEVAEAAGEIFNMISGQARQGLEAAGRSYQGSIPSIFRGRHDIAHITAGPQIAVPFTAEKGTVTIEFCFEPI